MINKINAMRAAAVTLATFGISGVLAMSATAAPEPTDLEQVGTAVEGAFGDMGELFLTVIAPAIFGLVIAIIAVTFGIRKLRQNTK